MGRHSAPVKVRKTVQFVSHLQIQVAIRGERCYHFTHASKASNPRPRGAREVGPFRRGDT